MKQKSMGGRALMLDACDLDDYTSTTYLKDLNRHMELVMEWSFSNNVLRLLRIGLRSCSVYIKKLWNSLLSAVCVFEDETSSRIRPFTMFYVKCCFIQHEGANTNLMQTKEWPYCNLTNMKYSHCSMFAFTFFVSWLGSFWYFIDQTWKNVVWITVWIKMWKTSLLPSTT